MKLKCPPYMYMTFFNLKFNIYNSYFMNYIYNTKLI